MGLFWRLNALEQGKESRCFDESYDFSPILCLPVTSIPIHSPMGWDVVSEKIAAYVAFQSSAVDLAQSFLSDEASNSYSSWHQS